MMPQFYILFLLVSFGSVGAVLFTPSLPEIQSFFGISVGAAQFTVTSYLIGYALGQLPYGPLANRFGRKRAIYIGISLSIFACLLCAFSAYLGSFALLVFARFLQSLGASVGLKMSFTMIADACEQTEATKMISLMLFSFAIMPAVGVTIGGWITQYVNWEACFYFLALFGGGVLWLSRRLPETIKSLDYLALKLSSITAKYGKKFKNKRIVLSGLMMGCTTAVIYVFAAKAPFIGIKIIGLSPEKFGLYNLIPILGMGFGGYLANRLAGRFRILTLLLFGTIACLLANLTILIPFAMEVVTAWSLFLPMILIYVVNSVVFANASSFGLSAANDKANASAVIQFLNVGCAMVAVFLVEFIYPESALLLPLSFAFLYVVLLLFWFRLNRLETA